MVDIKQLRTKTEEQLLDTLNELIDSYYKIRMQVSQKSESNYSKLTLLRKDIARVKTIINEKEILDNAKDSING